MRELLEGFSKAHVWVIGFSTDLQQTKTREQYMSMWDPICQKHTPLDRRIVLLSILQEYLKAWKMAMQKPPDCPKVRAQVLLFTLEV